MELPQTQLRKLAPTSADTLLEVGSAGFLNQCRLMALDCRCAARTDLFDACALLVIDAQYARTRALEGLIRCLPQIFERGPVFYRPGVTEASFDESWLLQLLHAAADEDKSSFNFLLRSRVPRLARGQVAYLVGIVTG
ncbi:MAG: hypothetical protein AAGA19_16710 [Pseudomonadota bacterium]